jgi:hypothetical protein
VFTKSDFFPDGTRPGLVAGIPPGSRAMRVQADKVDGFFELRPGDHFDLMATLPIDTKSNPTQNLSFGGTFAQALSLQAQLTNWQKQATVRCIVADGIVVEGLMTRQVPVYSTTLTQGALTRMRPVQEIVLALKPDEVARLTEAIAVDAKIQAVPRSGRPGDPQDSTTPDLRPFSPFDTGAGPTGRGLTVVESIVGSKRQLHAIPR